MGDYRTYRLYYVNPAYKDRIQGTGVEVTAPNHEDAVWKHLGGRRVLAGVRYLVIDTETFEAKYLEVKPPAEPELVEVKAQ